jgi:hypothetical protein
MRHIGTIAQQQHSLHSNYHRAPARAELFSAITSPDDRLASANTVIVTVHQPESPSRTRKHLE